MTPSHAVVDDLLFQWRRRLTALVTIAALVGGAVSLLGFRILGPSDQIKTVVGRVDTITSIVMVNSGRISRLEGQMISTIYLNCEVLRRVNPRNAVMPNECASERGRP